MKRVARIFTALDPIFAAEHGALLGGHADAELVGTDTAKIICETVRLLTDGGGGSRS